MIYQMHKVRTLKFCAILLMSSFTLGVVSGMEAPRFGQCGDTDEKEPRDVAARMEEETFRSEGVLVRHVQRGDYTLYIQREREEEFKEPVRIRKIIPGKRIRRPHGIWVAEQTFNFEGTFLTHDRSSVLYAQYFRMRARVFFSEEEPYAADNETHTQLLREFTVGGSFEAKSKSEEDIWYISFRSLKKGQFPPDVAGMKTGPDQNQGVRADKLEVNAGSYHMFIKCRHPDEDIEERVTITKVEEDPEYPNTYTVSGRIHLSNQRFIMSVKINDAWDRIFGCKEQDVLKFAWGSKKENIMDDGSEWEVFFFSGLKDMSEMKAYPSIARFFTKSRPKYFDRSPLPLL